MAERESQGFLTEAISFVAAIYHAVMADGHIASGVRQGFNELANAFGQVWPDHVAVVEPGSLFHPLHSDISAENHAHAERAIEAPLPSPSQIASEPIRPAQADHSHDYQPGREM